MGFVDGARLVGEAWRLLRRERELRWPALAPFAISAIAILGATAGIVAYAGDLWALVTAWLPWPEAGAWFAWLWVGPLRVVITVAGALLFALAAVIALAVAFLLATLVGAPFHDVLSRRVERVVTGGVVDLAGAGVGGFVRDTAGVVLADLQRVSLFLALQGAILALGLVPGLQIVAAPALVLVTIYFLPVEYAGYALDRRGYRFRAKLAWMRERRAQALGFGAAACLVCAVPVVNFAALPILVTAGTLLVVRDER